MEIRGEKIMQGFDELCDKIGIDVRANSLGDTRIVRVHDDGSVTTLVSGLNFSEAVNRIVKAGHALGLDI
jgi:hypothetical protein